MSGQNYIPRFFETRIKCFRVASVKRTNTNISKNKSTQKVVRFANGESNSIYCKTNTMTTNTVKHLPKCYVNPENCDCVDVNWETYNGKVWKTEPYNKLWTKKTHNFRRDFKQNKHEMVPFRKENEGSSYDGHQINHKNTINLEHKNKFKDKHYADKIKNSKAEKNVKWTHSKKPHEIERDEIGDFCDNNQCKDLHDYYIKNSRPKKDKKFTKSNVRTKINNTNENEKVGFGDQVINNDVICNSYKNLKKLLTSIVNKESKKSEELKQVPALEIRVDSNNMRVTNANEIRSKVRELGTVKNDVCVCPSRKKRLSSNVCESGMCKSAYKNKQDNFNCRCIKTNNECSDSTCNKQDQGKDKSKCILQRFKNKPTKRNKHLFEVKLDSSNMDIVNSDEIKEIFKIATNREICPDGICRKAVASNKKNVNINCRCINKKLTPNTIECSDRTCEGDSDFETYNPITKVFRICSKHSGRTKKSGMKDRDGKINDKIRGGMTRRANEKSRRLGGKTKRIGGMSIGSVSSSKKGKRRKAKPKKKPDESCTEKLEREEKLYMEQEKKTKIENAKILQAIKNQRKKEAGQWNCLSNFISGILNLSIETVKTIFKMIFSIISNPIGSFVYVKEKAKDPQGTVTRIKEWFQKTWGSKKSQMSNIMKDSEALSVISDQLEDMAVFDAIFANKGKTKEEQKLYERRKRMRKKRMQKRHDQALYGCENLLLTTLRKTPCLWCYYLCPNMYPQCLSLMMFLKNFFHILIYLAALACWTPCIATFELCRALLCCILCTG